jgi:hypothetical protein
MTQPAIKALLDLDQDGVYETDISAFIKAFTLAGGRANGLEKMDPRRFSLELDNSDGRFSPKNTSGTYYPNWKQGKPIKLQAALAGDQAVTIINDNPSFETDINGVTAVNATVAQDTTQARFGKACLKITAGAGVGKDITFKLRSGVRFPVTAGNKYQAQWFLKTALSTAFFRMDISWYNSGGGLISTSGGTFWTGKNYWGAQAKQRESATSTIRGDAGMARAHATSTITAPVGAVTAELHLIDEFNSWPNGTIVFVDGLNFLDVTSLGATELEYHYVDGDQPFCAWTGTAHQSTATCTPATLTKATGIITDLDVSREGYVGTCRLQAASQDYDWRDQEISVGIMHNQPIGLILNRILDIAELGEIIVDGGLENSDTNTNLLLDTYHNYGYFHIGGNAVARAVYPSLLGALAYLFEGSAFGYIADGVGKGFKNTPTSGFSNGVNYTASIFIRSLDDAVNATFRLLDDSGTRGTVTVPLSTTAWQYVTVSGTFNGNNRRVELEMGGTVTIAWDGLHAVPTANRIARDIRGSAATALTFPGAYRRSVNAILDDVVDSAGGVWWENGSGVTVFEDYAVRSGTPVPKVRISDSGELDGLAVPKISYSERFDVAYGIVDVYSNGALTDPSSDPAKMLWALAPLPVLGNNESRIYNVYYYSEEGKPVLGRGEMPYLEVSAGAVTARLTPYGVGGTLVLTAGAAGATLTKCEIHGRLALLQSERSRISYTVPGASTRRPPRTLPLDMPYQGDRTAVMTAVAQAVGDRYADGRQAISVPLKATDFEEAAAILAFDLSDPVWLRHNSGRAFLGLNEAYYIEGFSLDGRTDESGWVVTGTWTLEASA